MVKVPSISGAAVAAVTTMARIASSRAGPANGGGGGGGGSSLGGADIQALSGAYERAILRMAAGAGEEGGGERRVAASGTTLSLVTSPSDADVVSAAVRLARSRAAPRRGRLLLRAGRAGGEGCRGGHSPSSRRSRFLARICPSRRRAAAEAAASEAAAADADNVAAAKAGPRLAAATGGADGGEASVPRGHHRLTAASPSPLHSPAAAASADSQHKAVVAAEWVVGLEANRSDVLVVPSADVDVDLHGRYPVSAVSSASASSSSSPPGSPGATAAVAVGRRHGCGKTTHGGAPLGTSPPTSASALSASSAGSSSTGGGAPAAAAVRSMHAPPSPSAPAAAHRLAAVLKSASADDGYVALSHAAARRREASAAPPPRLPGVSPGATAGCGPTTTCRSASPTVPVVAAALAAAPARLGLRPPENSVDSYNVHVTYAPDEFVAFLDRRSAPRAPRLPWVARWVPGRHPPPTLREEAGGGGDAGRGEEGGLAAGGPSWANEWGSTVGPAAATAAAHTTPAAAEPSSPSAARPPLASKPPAIRRVADVLARGRRQRQPVSTV
ncbi:hypothetical protein I4F81_009766 [Pyropia yezoensis]|uniref:Uncharacterized protein n=1 Tax=Pyropia yezoensis TaxID=2788 RepID=A0ACC3CAF8_PYRYE|nr:hypothetical protein I4F81_009766 [Neopyropia yezoensis]